MLTRIALRSFVVAVPAHFIWEMAHMGLFSGVPVGFWASVPICARASLGDGALTALILGLGALVFGTAAWPRRPGWAPWVAAVGLSFTVAVVMEWVNVYGLGRWAYAPDMIIVPGLGVGLTPVLQLVLLTPPILWWASRADR